MAENKVILYGASWCVDCRRAKKFLDQNGVPYKYVDIEKDEDAERFVIRANNGKSIIPTIQIGEEILTNPDGQQLGSTLGIADEVATNLYEVVVVGGGPAGITAAIYTARERLETVVLEKSIMASQLFATDRIENYPGFPEGISGPELADLFEKQARTFGAELVPNCEVTSIRSDGIRITVDAQDKRYVGRSVILSTGSNYRRLGVPGEKELTGFGVSYCATCDAPFYRDKEIVVVGGGNSAVQESLHLAKFARSITILQLLDELTATKLLQEKLEVEPKISVRYNCELQEIYGDKRVEGVKYKDHTAGETVDLPCGGVFVFIGLTPNTDFLKGIIDLDDQGFVVTPPDSLETSMPGVFAAGDVRAGSIKQIASAAGEGTVASFLAKAYAEAHAGTSG